MHQENVRDSNIELLRIISMLMILILHYLNGDMGGALSNVTSGTVNYYIVHLLESAAIIAVNIYIIISGYFLIRKSSINLKKIYNIVFVCLFYGIIIYIIELATGQVELNKSTLKTFIDTIVNRWFIVNYIILYLLSPYINRLVLSLSQKQLKYLITMMLVFFSILPITMERIIGYNTIIRDAGYGIVNFVMLYLIGGYIKLYKDDKKYICKSLLIYIGTTIITTLFSLKFAMAYNYNSIFNIVGAVAVFMIFKGIKLKNGFINKLAKYTLSVYIIHENSFIVKYIYQNIFKTPQYYNSNWIIIHLIVTVVLMYLVCVVIDIIRSFIFSKTIDKVLNSKYINKKITIE